jgi:hypothetical protein
MSGHLIDGNAPQICRAFEGEPELLDIALNMYIQFNVTELEVVNIVSLAKLGDKAILDQAMSGLQRRVKLS